MQGHNEPQGRVRRTVNELVIAEMFLVQATIESASIIGDGFNELGRTLSDGEDAGEGSRGSISSLLQRIADEAMEPYTSRFRYFKDLVNGGS
jgi:hypothetical protein